MSKYPNPNSIDNEDENTTPGATANSSKKTWRTPGGSAITCLRHQPALPNFKNIKIKNPFYTFIEISKLWSKLPTKRSWKSGALFERNDKAWNWKLKIDRLIRRSRKIGKRWVQESGSDWLEMELRERNKKRSVWFGCSLFLRVLQTQRRRRRTFQSRLSCIISSYRILSLV